jgi:hypothetical protein
MYFPEQARKMMEQVPAAADWSSEEWEAMRKRHRLGDDQILALSEWQRGMKDSYDEMNSNGGAGVSSKIRSVDREVRKLVVFSLGPLSIECYIGLEQKH